MNRKTFFAVLVGALGYFVDVYDLILFSVVRVASLKDILPEGADLAKTGVLLLNMQMGGMLAGGLLWGVWGDKKGRLAILFGSILLYSAANVANAFVTEVWQYAACRLLAGIGLAGELGAGITLVAELLPKEKRGIGTAVVATVGVAGGVAASLVGDLFHWQTAYVVGGCMGFVLFLLRVSVSESGMFSALEKKKGVTRGSLKMLFFRWSCLQRYVLCVLTGLPLWFIAGLVLTFAPEIGRALGLASELKSADAILYFYAGLIGGDLASGLVSQYLRSRRKALGIFIAASFLGTLTILGLPAGAEAGTYYLLCGVTGFFAGYWAMLVTVD
jgi:MFS family permease